MNVIDLTTNVLHFSLIRKSDLPSYTIVCFSTDSCHSASHPISSNSSETSTSCTRCSATGSCVAVLSRSSSASTQISSTLLSPADATIRSPWPLKPATSNEHILVRGEQQARLAHTPETLAAGERCIQETRINDSSSVIRLTSHPIFW